LEREVDLVLVAAYGRILPPDALAAPRLGCVNVHASLLPRWRGASPIQHAIASGDPLTGVCLMQMDAGLDTGPVLARIEVEIEPSDTAQSLHDRLADAGAHLVGLHHRALLEGTLPATPQDDDASRAAPPLQRSDGQIAWDRPARAIDRHIRAMTPWPGASTTWQGDDEVWKLFADGLQVGELSGKPGTLLDIDGSGASFACGEGSLRIATMQRPGRRRMDASSALRGARIEAGACCDVQGRRFDDD
jgi:methionyl-tRNA formyltransferase